MLCCSRSSCTEALWYPSACLNHPPNGTFLNNRLLSSLMAVAMSPDSFSVYSAGNQCNLMAEQSGCMDSFSIWISFALSSLRKLSASSDVGW